MDINGEKIKNRITFYVSNSIKIHGNNNSIARDDTSFIKNCRIAIYGNNNKIVIGNECFIRGLNLTLSGNGNVVEFGKMVSINGNKIQPTVIQAVGGRNIKIGDGCLLASDISIQTSDYHAIYNDKGKRINQDKDVVIGRNVWLATGVRVLKGSEIGNGCVVGAGSIIAGKYETKNAVLVGNPIRIVRERIFWSKGICENSEVPDDLKIECSREM